MLEFLKFDGMVFSVVIGWVVAMRNELMIGSMRFSCIRRAALPVLLMDGVQNSHAGDW